MEQDLVALKRRRFLWGMALGWAPLAFLVFGLANAFRGVSESKATGLGAVAGGFSEYFTLFGVVTAVTFEVAAIVLLVGGLTKQTPGRSVLSLLTIFCCGVWLLTVAIGMYLMLRYVLAS